MMSIATLTLNPTIDVAYEVDHVFHTRKMRTLSEYYEPGGGGINVARVFVRLGGSARNYYLSGGAMGHALDGLLDLHKLVRNRIAIKGHTRVASAVLERDSGKEYRFVPAGPSIEPEEWQLCLGQLAEVQCDYMVVSGSLPPGVPDDFYGHALSIQSSTPVRAVREGTRRDLDGKRPVGPLDRATPSTKLVATAGPISGSAVARPVLQRRRIAHRPDRNRRSAVPSSPALTVLLRARSVRFPPVLHNAEDARVSP